MRMRVGMGVGDVAHDDFDANAVRKVDFVEVVVLGMRVGTGMWLRLWL